MLSRWNRRVFLKRTLGAGAALSASPTLWTPPALAVPRQPASAAKQGPIVPVRVRGRVETRGQGLAGVAVSDGLTVAVTEADGAFEIISSTRQPFVHLSVPAGYRIPQNETGTARFYQPIQAEANGEMDVQFTLAPLEGSDENHAFLALADPQTRDEAEMRMFHEETVPDVQATLKTLGDLPAFGVACGDIMFDNLDLYPRYEAAVAQMDVPFFQVIGNHDLVFEAFTDEGSSKTFSSHFGPTYYSFNRGAAHYVVLDNVFWNHDAYFGYLDGDQLTWLEQDLAQVEAGRPVIVFMHIPALGTRFRRSGEAEPSPSGSTTNRAALYRLLEGYQAHIVSGHTHESEHVYEGGVHEHVCGAVCGAWWTGPICYDGTPRGYGVYEVRGEDVRWRYQATGRPAQEQLRVYARGVDPKAPDELVANVWDWNPDWTVVWYEGGARRGQMARRTGTDPLAEQLYQGPNRPEKNSWVDPVPTDHLFYAPVSAEATDVRVEATDPWGNVYSATPEGLS